MISWGEANTIHREEGHEAFIKACAGGVTVIFVYNVCANNRCVHAHIDA